VALRAPGNVADVLARLRQAPLPLRLLAFLGILALVWLPLGLPIVLTVADANLRGILALVWLYLLFLGWVSLWERRVHGEARPFRRLGWEWSGRMGRSLLVGLAVGLLAVWGLFGLQVLCGWQQWNGVSAQFPRFLAEGALTGLGTALAEELLFRCWLLDELERSLRPTPALVSCAVIFALVHGTRPQFFTLLLLGLALVWAKRADSQRLGLPMGVHGGLVWGYYQLKVGELVTPLNEAFLGAGLQNNPLQSLAGLVAMALLALGLRTWAKRPQLSVR